jgi:hypothetical protein
MGYHDIIRKGVVTAHKLLGAIEEEITIERWTADTDQGKHVYAAPLKLDALVVHATKRLGFDTGMEIIATTTIVILTPIKKLSPVVTGREEPIDERDKITLSSGKTGPILQTEGGLTDPKTNRPYLMQVYLGGYQAGR